MSQHSWQLGLGLRLQDLDGLVSVVAPSPAPVHLPRPVVLAAAAEPLRRGDVSGLSGLTPQLGCRQQAGLVLTFKPEQLQLQTQRSLSEDTAAKWPPGTQSRPSGRLPK